MHAMRLSFTERRVSADGVPVLPEGRTGMSRDKAISAAVDSGMAPLARNSSAPLGVPAGIPYDAHYGLFSHAARGPLVNGSVQPVWLDAPVWLVRFGGLRMPVRGPNPGRLTWSELDVVVDAETGEVMTGFAAR